MQVQASCCGVSLIGLVREVEERMGLYLTDFPSWPPHSLHLLIISKKFHRKGVFPLVRDWQE